MKIRTTLFTAFLIAALLPSTLMTAWSYHHSVEREFAEVKDRHLLLAQSLKGTLERYHIALTVTIESISASLLTGKTPPGLRQLMSSVNLVEVIIIDQTTGSTIAQANADPLATKKPLSDKLVADAQSIAVTDQTVFSPVMESRLSGNVILGARRYENKLAVSIVKTDFFVTLGKSISFGDRGHAAIVDHMGNLLAHPTPQLQQSRLNISAISIVQKMMNGESGIDSFYSPALKDDMIAGFATLDGSAGWGVMVPQPVAEIYAKVGENNRALLVALVTALLLALGFALVFVNSIASPLEHFLALMKTNACHEDVREAQVATGIVPLSELQEFNHSYNIMARRVSSAKDRIQELAYLDNVTGLPNRIKLEYSTDRLLADKQQLRGGGVFVFIDVDNFKQINDLFGHSTGDLFLRDTACKIQQVVTATTQTSPAFNTSSTPPLVARIGGDEFAILFPSMNDRRDTETLLSALNQVLTEPGEGLPLFSRRSSSIGCSRYPVDGTSLSELMKKADIAMYHAKNSGKNRHQIFDHTVVDLTAAEMARAVSCAIEAGEMTLEYQPKICARTGQISGAEALVRWDNRQRGRLMPDKWIPSIANTPVMRQLGEWLVGRVMADQQLWATAGLEIKVAINVGSEHFEESGFGDWLYSTAAKHNYDPRFLEIELTENTLFSSGTAAEETLRKLSKYGFKIAIDDFGTGYSNIARLTQLSIDSLKIDRTIISNAPDDEKMASIMECIVMMADRLGVETVAEGIENDQQINYCTSLGVDVLQGFYYSHSLPWAELLEWAQAREQKAESARSQKQKQNVSYPESYLPAAAMS